MFLQMTVCVDSEDTSAVFMFTLRLMAMVGSTGASCAARLASCLWV